MKRILYVETNFAVGIAKGQEPEASSFLETPHPDIGLVFPGVCYMESFSNLAYEMRTRGDLYRRMTAHAQEVKRDLTSARAVGLASDLENAVLKGEGLLTDLKARLDVALGKITLASVEIIGTDILSYESA